MRIGIDPGIAGAIAFLQDDATLIEVVDMPVMILSGKKQQVNAAALADLIRPTIDHFPSMTAYVERVSAMPGQGVAAMFNFGTSFGVIIGVLGALQIPMVLVTPGQWKRRASLVGKDKGASRTLAQQLYPAAPLDRVKDIGRADAILIACYGPGI